MHLIDEVCTVGRSNANTFAVGHDEAGTKLPLISKVHFAVRKSSEVIILVDKSTNGTFVNGYKLGFDKSRRLLHNDLISFTNPSQNQYIFLRAGSDYLQGDFPEELKQKYVISRDLGAGAFGVVKLGFMKEDQGEKSSNITIPVAIKRINKLKFPCDKEFNKTFNEVDILKALQHPNIIKLWDVINLGNELYIILEYANGGELFDTVIENCKLDEKQAKLYFYQIVSAVQHMHQNSIVHRDLKLENILLCCRDNEDIPSLVKVTDFGLSKMVNQETFLKTVCGTKLYVAPEIIRANVDEFQSEGNEKYNLKVDMWSLGVILYIILTGSSPFDQNCVGKSIEKQICDGDFSFPPSLWASVSFEAKDLVRHLLVVNSQKRYNCDQATNHDWLMEPEMLDRANEITDKEQKRLCIMFQKNM